MGFRQEWVVEACNRQKGGGIQRGVKQKGRQRCVHSSEHVCVCVYAVVHSVESRGAREGRETA